MLHTRMCQLAGLGPGVNVHPVGLWFSAQLPSGPVWFKVTNTPAAVAASVIALMQAEPLALPVLLLPARQSAAPAPAVQLASTPPLSSCQQSR